jgi:hypothetical protein
MGNKIIEISELKSITAKFASRISDKIGIVKKDVSKFPYSATEYQVRNQIYGIEYTNLLFKTAKWLVKDSDYLKIAINDGCKFTTTYKIKKPPLCFYSDYVIKDGKCYAIFETEDGREVTVLVCETTKKLNTDWKEFSIKETKNYYFINLGE